jgi:hypothetical protein
MCGDQLVAAERGLPFALAASDQESVSGLVGQPVARVLGGVVAAPFNESRTRIGEHVGHHSSLVGSCGCEPEGGGGVSAASYTSNGSAGSGTP